MEKDIVVRKGSVLNSPANVIAHQVNCMGVMGSGVAKAIKNQYPIVYKVYREYCQEKEASTLLGDCLLVNIGEEKYVANLFGQFKYGTDKRQTNYVALEAALNKLKETMIKKSLKCVSFPYMIGCGLAGGNIEEVKELIERVFLKSDIAYDFYKID